MDVNERIKDHIESNPVVLFMKGTPQMPMCGFSSRTSQALKDIGREFAYVKRCLPIQTGRLSRSFM